jgi:hypothetical protein
MFLFTLFVAIFLLRMQYSDASFVDRLYFKARNQYLRIYLLSKKENIKHAVFSIKDTIKEQTNDIYQLFLSRCYDANMIYYSLPEEERNVIEQIINLHF